VVYWFGKEFEAARRYEKAKNIYQQVVWRYPDSSHASKALLAASKMDVLSLIESGDDNAAQAALDNLIADFNDHPDSPEAVFVVGEQYYTKAFRCVNEDLSTEANDYFRKAVTTLETIIQKLPPSATYTPRACRLVAYGYYRLGEYHKAIEYGRKVVDNWPDSNHAGAAQFLIGDCFEKLRDSGSLPQSEANAKMERAYKAVVENYPDCASAKYAWPQLKLGWLNFERGQWGKAAQYFEISLKKCPENQRPSRILYALGRAYEEMGQLDKAADVYNEFIKSVSPDDPRIETVKARLEKLGLTSDN